MENRFDRMDKRFDDTNERINQTINAIDALAKRQEISDDERIVMAHQLDRLNAWMQQLAVKIGVTLSA